MSDIKETTEQDVAKVGEIVNSIRPLLGGQGAHIQGAVIADIVSIFIAAHAPHLRKTMMDGIVKTAMKMVPMNENILFGGKHPYTVLYGEEPDNGNQHDHP